MGSNPNQVLRYFYKIYPVDGLGLEDEVNASPDEYENWYQIKDGASHELFFNYETREYILRYPETYWKESEIAHFRLTEKEVAKKNERYKNKNEEIINTTMYKKIKTLYEWFFSCPIPSVCRAALPSPNEFILEVLKWNTYHFNLREKKLKELKDTLFWAFIYEEEKNKAPRNEKGAIEPPNTMDIDEVLKILKKYRSG